MIRELVFALLLMFAAVAVVVGVARMYEPAAWVVGGILLAVFAWLVLAGVETVERGDGEGE